MIVICCMWDGPLGVGCEGKVRANTVDVSRYHQSYVRGELSYNVNENAWPFPHSIYRSRG